jgi:SAM-dependent methyltransferase
MKQDKKICVCPVCGCVSEKKFLSKYKCKKSIFENMFLLGCGSCGFVFANPMPLPVNLDNYYKSIWLNDGLISTSEDALLTYKLQAEERVKYILSKILIKDNAKILDVGSGYGYLRDAFFDKNIKINFYAVEPCISNKERLESKGAVVYDDLSKITSFDFDLIALCFVLEHVCNPKEFISKLFGYIKKGGYIFVDLPDRDDTFKNLHEPHLGFYNIDSFKRLIDGIDCEIIDIIGYGKKKSDIARKQNYLCLGVKKLRNLFAKSNIGNRTKELYEEFRFGEEGPDRWWFRAIIKKN